MSDLPVRVRVGEHTVLVMAEAIGDSGARLEGESPVSERTPRMEEAIAAAASAAEEAARAFLAGGIASVTVEIGIEFAIESGSLIAVIGKASSKSSIKVIANYERPAG
ncbi:CU044_2847 family protein [Promicromonospora sp. NPDC023805]|uniref:CU044_2847 family protein n=1 Tax=Promicromonospora sp. NPDC023805 TaxID=3154696 RepID=UPI0033CA0334